MPPDVFAVAVPSFTPHPVGSVLLELTVGALGAVNVVELEVLQFPPSVIVTLYTPLERPDIDEVVAPLLQL